LEAFNFSENRNTLGLENLLRHSKTLEKTNEQIKGKKNKNYENEKNYMYFIIPLIIISTILITLLSSLFCFLKYESTKPVMYQPRDVVAETQI